SLRDLAELDLHAFPVGKPDAEAFALAGVISRNLQAAFGETQPAHAMRQSRRAEPDLCHFQSVADAERHVLIGNFQAVEFELAMAAMLLRSHDRDAAHDPPARLVAMVQKRGEATASVVRGACDKDEMRSLAGAGDEPFSPGDDPFAVFPLGARA